MEPESHPTPYAFVYDLVVQHVSRTSDDARFLWLEHGQLEHLIPHLTSKQVPLLFATELMCAAYLHGEGSDTSLRHLVTLLQESFSGHPEIVSELEQILSFSNLGRALFPSGLSVTDTETLLRANAHFLSMPDSPEDPLPNVAHLPPPHHMRLDRNTDFVGREAELKEIARAIKRERGVVVAAGIGGVGKTQMAIEWVHRYGQYFAGGVFWLDFQDANTARLSVATAGIAYGWEAYSALDLDTQIAKVRRQWNEPMPVLLIFDNCEDVDLAYEYLPVGSGAKVLLTSRDTTWQSQVGNRGILQVEIITLPRAESITLLQRLCPSLIEIHANDIAEALGDLPLALHLAGSYLAKYAGTPFGDSATYLKALRVNLVPHLEDNAARMKLNRSPTNHTHSVYATFSLSWERLRAKTDLTSELAESLLGLLAQFAPGTVVPDKWLLIDLPEGINEQDLIDAIELLQSNGLVERTQRGELRLHRLVAELVKKQQLNQKHAGISKQADRVLGRTSPRYGALDYIAQMEVWLVHARYRSVDAVERGDIEGAVLLNSLGVALNFLAQYTEAMKCCTQSLSIRREVLGTHHVDTITSLNNLAFLCQVQGEYKQALVLYEESLAVRKEVLGERHPDTALGVMNLAGLYKAKGEYERALVLYKESLVVRKEVLGGRHPDTALNLNNLGDLYLELGQYESALDFFQEALAIYQEVFGTFHPDTALVLNNLGDAYQALGQYENALRLYEEALLIRKKVLGARHPDTASSLISLGTLHQATGEYERALPPYEEALATYQEVFGLKHPHTALLFNNVATIYDAKGDYGRALPLYEEALQIRRLTLGERHPATAISLNNLGYLHQVQGEYERAQSLYEEALLINREVLGNQHPSTGLNLNNLGSIYKVQGDYGNALLLYKEVLAIYRETFGDHHPDTAMGLNNLASVYEVQGDYERALHLFEEALKINRNVLGAHHPNTTRCIINLGNLYQVKGEYRRALDLFSEAVVNNYEVLGERHPDTAISLINLAYLYQVQGEYLHAQSLYQTALFINREVLGYRHTSTALSLNNLASVYEAQENYREALPLYEEALAIFTTLLGTQHPNTIIIWENRDTCLQKIANTTSL